MTKFNVGDRVVVDAPRLDWWHGKVGSVESIDNLTHPVLVRMDVPYVGDCFTVDTVAFNERELELAEIEFNIVTWGYNPDDWKDMVANYSLFDSGWADFLSYHRDSDLWKDNYYRGGWMAAASA